MKCMRGFPLVLAIFDGFLHACPLSESGIPLIQYGELHWTPVMEDVSAEFLSEAKALMVTSFRLTAK